MFHEFGIGCITCVSMNEFFERERLVGVVRGPFLAVHTSIEIKQWIIGRNGPVTAVGDRVARIENVPPGKGQMPALRTDTCRPNIPFGNTKGRVAGLHRRQHAQLFEAWQVIRMNDLDVLNAMTTVPFPIGPLNCFVAIECTPHRTISAAVDENLQPHFVA